MKFPGTTNSCAIVVPCFNEADRLKVDVFAEFVCDVDDVELIFVDDGSSDSTLQSAQTVSDKAGSSVSVLRLEENCGKAECVRGCSGLLDRIFLRLLSGMPIWRRPWKRFRTLSKFCPGIRMSKSCGERVYR